MSSWQGANLKRPSKKARQTPTTETVEAALNRLQKYYGTVMECLRAWHRADAALAKGGSNDNDNNLDPLYKVGRAARQTLENSIFRDGLVEPHAPAWSSLHHELTTASRASSHSTVELRSAGHKSTIRQLAYLSLVNYGDLLLQGLPPPPPLSRNSPRQQQTILDRGVVRSLKAMQYEGLTASCWLKEVNSASGVSDAMEINGQPSSFVVEPEDETLRFALVAYLDASALDGSDSTLWLKLACVARRLGRVLARKDCTSFDGQGDDGNAAFFLKHRRLEKHALERAVSVLPASQPPNRTAVRALAEWHREENVSEYQPILAPDPVPQYLVLELPRYSWSTLGRMLLRACREGSSFSNSNYFVNTTKGPSVAVSNNNGAIFVSPNVRIHLSPLLVLPTTVLANVCSFLEASQIWRFESTCRAMSASIISARAVLDNDLDASRRSMRRLAAAAQEETKCSDDINSVIGQSPPPPIPPQRSRSRGSSNEGDTTNKRVSKRVQSQIITSGKRAERSNRRNSVEYCLLAATLGCSRNDENYKKLVRDAEERVAEAHRDILKYAFVERVSSAKEVALERLSDSSLHNFVEQMSSRQFVSPLAFLFDFVAHASLHVSEVFASDPAGSIVMSSCLLECFDLMARRTNLSNGDINLSWSASPQKVPANSTLEKLEVFAIDLLHTELRLKLCDGEDLVDFGFESDGSFVSVMVPYLISLSEEVDQEVTKVSVVWPKLRSRCFWLAASYYLWRGRLSTNLGESRDAEEEGLRFIDSTRRCLEVAPPGSPLSVFTPHLGSPSRRGSHWQELTVESLSAYSDEIQASSVVLLAQEQFLDATSKFSRSHLDQPLTKADRDALISIGESLMHRYDTVFDSPGAKHSELIDDFLAVHGEKLLSTFDGRQNADEGETESLEHRFGGLIASGRVKTVRPFLCMPNPCILNIITCCLKTKEGNETRITTLLVRLVLGLLNLSEGISARIIQQSERKKLSGGASDSDSDEDSISDDESLDSPRSADSTRLHQYALFIHLLVPEIRMLCSKELSDLEKATLVESDELAAMIRQTLKFCSDWFPCSVSATFEDRSSGIDLGILIELKALFCCLTPSIAGSQFTSLTSIYLLGLIHITDAQRRTLCYFSRLKPKAKGRARRQEMTRRRTDLVATACCDAGLLLSVNQVEVLDSGTMKRSSLFENPEFTNASIHPLVQFSDALSWLWKAATSSSHSDIGSHLSSYLDSSGRSRLRVSVATAIVALCGSASSTDNSFIGDEMIGAGFEEELSIFEFYDSDASAVEWTSDERDERGSGGSINDDRIAKRTKEKLLRVILQAVHCISCVFSAIDDGEAANFPHIQDYVTVNGPILPLVVSRTLNQFSFHLLVHFAESEAVEKVWSDYSFGTRAIGQLLDSMLYKAYKILHGFTLTNSSVESKDTATAGTGSNMPNAFFPPESSSAAVMLYRCVMRAYSNGRKSPPKAALDAISVALPEFEESAKARAIRKFLFSANAEDARLSRLMSLVLRPASWKSTFDDVDGFGWIHEDACNGGDFQDEIYVVRRGLARLIAQGPLPTFQDSGDINDSRSAAAHAEEELSRKFSAVVDDLCFGTINDCEGWFKASQCLITKADIIADRLGLTKGFGRCKNFIIAERRGIAEESMDITELVARQGREQRLKEEGWTHTLGKDIAVFVDHAWSSFESLKACSEMIGEVYNVSQTVSVDEEDHEDQFGARVWREIHGHFLKKDFIGWQQAWGGLFVSSLRKAAHRCLLIALYLSYKASNDHVVSEISESLGVSLYTELMGSQEYGYPMQEMTPARKREIAEAALACFERAICVENSVSDRGEDIFDIDEARGVWDLHFMIGKCHEKIASTYEREKFRPIEGSSGERLVRGYERNMKFALQAYATSLSQAKAAEISGVLCAEQDGGSSHGAAEVLYRLHASRLKCLIAAVNRNEDERDAAEYEALRLTECFWFSVPDETRQESAVRERVWRVLVDVVNALARCRLDNVYFHRSVYRHAQALMWAPVLYDPVEGRAKGSLGTVSATWACKIRGLNYATTAASSAVAIMSTLFEKKRSQLVAVWLTADGSSTFQTINNSVRKYDTLRGKYSAAYIESLRLCARRKELETVLRWTTTAVRDLPSYFAASAVAQGGKPQRSHTQDSLLLKGRSLSPHFFLTTVKRQANSALAFVILQDLKANSDNDQKFLENQLKLAYACFLRLNCDPKILSKSHAWKYHRRNGAKDVVAALTAAYSRIENEQPQSGEWCNWSGESQLTSTLQLALQKCKEMFPTVSGKFYISKKTTTPKKSAPESVGNKELTVEKTFVVSVPPGLAEGGTFMASINVGNTSKKVRLTVPSGNASSLRFNLQVPVHGGGENDGDSDQQE